jgi:4-amino-4-deoxy-L-arabinose transferase-like glycosyltransferase
MNSGGRGPAWGLVAWLGARGWAQAFVLIAVCGAVFLPRLGASGLSMSEGHRVIPAWEMLEDARAGEAHWLVPRMFGTAYLRKPPGVMWAIAASGAVLGQTEFAARLPSAIAATLLALAVWWFATRWFGSPWGLAAGLAQALLPVTWPSARSAEIESLHMLTTGAACLVVVHFAACRARSIALWTPMLGALIGAMLLTKGLAGTPFVVGAVIATGVGRARLSRLASMLFGIGAGAGGALALARHFRGADGENAVTQGVDEFLWDPERLAQIATLAPVVALTMLPASLALLFPWGPDARREREAERAEVAGVGRPPPAEMARTLALACLACLAILTLAGVSNPRYGLPVCALITPLLGYVARGAWGGTGGDAPRAGRFVARRPGIARAVLLGSPGSWPLVLLAMAVVYTCVVEPRRRESSGREAGIALAPHLPDGAVVWADAMIEARPEVLHYAVREAEREGRRVRVRWLKPEFMPDERPEGLLLLLREDGLVDEVAWFGREGRFGELTPIARGEVHKYQFVLVRPDRGS